MYSGGIIVGLIVARIYTNYYSSLRPVVTRQLETALPALSLRKERAAQIEHTVTEHHRYGLV